MGALPPRLLLLISVLAFLIGFVQLGILRIAFDKLGLSAESAFLLLMCTLGGSLINVPLFSLSSDRTLPPEILPDSGGWPRTKPPPFGSNITVAVNVGGAVVPVAFSLYLVTHNPLTLFQIAAAVAMAASVSYLVSRPIPRVGIGMPTLAAPLAAALAAILLNPEQRAPLAYVGGTLGVLIGADLIRLKDIRKLGVPWASIGGAGTFDGVFITGLVAVLLT